MSTAKPFWFTRVAVVALLLSFMAACDDETTGPSFQLDPESTADLVEELAADFFVGNDAAGSMEYFGDYISMALGSGPLLSASPPAEVAGGMPDHLLRNPVYSGPATIPAEYEGVTFVWDDLDGVYVPSERLGAPANGVRFILYAVNPITGEPVTPVTENEIGYLDISDDSTWPNIDITVEAVIDDVTLIYAHVTGYFGETSAWLDLDGYFSDGNEQLLFDLYASESMTAFVFEFSLEYGDFEAIWEMTYTEAGLDVDVTFTDGTNTIIFSMSVVEDTITDGTITFNGEVVAIIEGYFYGEEADVTITNAEGDPLTAAELAALADVFEAMGDLSEFMDGMLEFAVGLAYLNEPIQ
ncbi:MAG: hypothetical protein PVG79_12030 [Gemmatimonadales bacterium]